MMFFAAALAALVGACNAVANGSNAALGRHLDDPIFAAMMITVIHLVIFTTVWLSSGGTVPGGRSFAGTPWWAWLGGLTGAAFILVSVKYASELGAAVFLALVVTASVLMSVALDHFGLVGFDQRTATPLRMIGCALMIGGVAMVAKF